MPWIPTQWTNRYASTSVRGKIVATESKPREDTERIEDDYDEYGDDPSKFIGTVLSIEGVVDRVIGFLSPKERHRSCILVSKVWRDAVRNGVHVPLALRIEDIEVDSHDGHKAGKVVPHHTRHHQHPNSFQAYGDPNNNNNNDEIIRYPLHAIGKLPSWVAARTTKLVLVLRFVRKHASQYDLNDFLFYQGRPCWFLHRFHNLQDLTILTEFASDQFVSILSPPTNTTAMFQTTRTAGIPSLKRIHFEETNVSNWRNSYLQRFVELAPNLEVLHVRENMKWKWNVGSKFFQAEDIRDLLPLSKSLKALVLFNRPNIRGNFEEFLAEMPLLQSWDIYNSFLYMGDCPRTLGLIPQKFEDNSYRWVDLNDHPHFVKYARDEAEFILTMQDVLVPWYLGLNDVNIHPWKHKIAHMIGYIDAIMREYFETDDQFLAHRPPRPYRLPTLGNLLEVDTSLVSKSGDSWSGSSQKHANYCCATRNKTKLQNYQKVVRPCMKLYYHEFIYFCDSHAMGAGYSKFQEFRQKQELKRFIKRITRAEDSYSKGSLVWFRQSTKGKDFSVLV